MDRVELVEHRAGHNFEYRNVQNLKTSISISDLLIGLTVAQTSTFWKSLSQTFF